MKFFKRKKKFKKIKRKEYAPFLVRVDKAMLELTHDYFVKSQEKILKQMKDESNKWFNFLDEMETNSFKAGVCYGMYRFLQFYLLEKAKQKESYVV